MVLVTEVSPLVGQADPSRSKSRKRFVLMGFLLSVCATLVCVFVANFQNVHVRHTTLMAKRHPDRLGKLGVGIDSWPWDQEHSSHNVVEENDSDLVSRKHFRMSVLGDANASQARPPASRPGPRQHYANTMRVPWFQGYYGSPLGHELPRRTGRLPIDTCSEDTPNCNKLWLKTGVNVYTMPWDWGNTGRFELWHKGLRRAAAAGNGTAANATEPSEPEAAIADDGGGDAPPPPPPPAEKQCESCGGHFSSEEERNAGKRAAPTQLAAALGGRREPFAAWGAPSDWAVPPLGLKRYTY